MVVGWGLINPFTDRIENRYSLLEHPLAGLVATFEVGGASARVGGEIYYFLMGVLHKMY